MTKQETSAFPSPFQKRLSRAWTLARGGTASIVGSAVTGNLLRIVNSMTLTRLLSADAFGVTGIIMSISFVLQLVSDVGLYPFIVRHKQGDDRAFLDEIWSLRLVRSAGLTLLMAALAWPVARFIGKPELWPVLLLWSLNFILEGLSSLSFATAVRERRLWQLTTLELLTTVAQLLLSIGLALLLHSYWALVIGMMCGVALKSLLSYLLFPGARRRFVLSRPRARELWAFSRYIAVSSFLTMLIMQSDKLVLARLLPLAAYGLYAIATTLALAPLGLAHTYTSRILYPAYAEAAREEPSRLAAIFYAKRRLVALAYMFATGGVLGGAKLLVAILYDPRYAAVTTYLQLVMVSTIVYFVNTAADEALIAAGRTRWTLYANIGRISWLAVAGVAALLTGHVFLLVAVVGAVEVAAMLCYWEGLRRLGVLRLAEEALGFGFAIAGAAAGYLFADTAFRLFPGL